MTLQVLRATAPIPEGDPRDWLVDEVLGQGAVTLPVLLMAGAGDQRQVMTDLDPDDIGTVEAALLAAPEVAWTAAWGTSVLPWEGRHALVTWVRLRQADGLVMVRAWPRLPGMPPEPDHAAAYDGPIDHLPAWAAPLFPALAPGAVVFVEQALALPEWPQVGAVRAPDLLLELPEGASARDALLAGAHVLEARFATGGEGRPAGMAWGEGKVAIWLGAGADPTTDARLVLVRVARDPRTLAVGLFGLGEHGEDDLVRPMVALLFEERHGPASMWMRRFRHLDDDTAEWVDDTGFVEGPVESMGWFAEE